MGLWKTIKGIFKEKELKARNFVEIHKTSSLEESNEVKAKLEKYVGEIHDEAHQLRRKARAYVVAAY
mgnify:CR=1 FL=1